MLAYNLSSHVDLVYSGDADENLWLLDLEMLRKVMVELVEGVCIDLQFSDASKIVSGASETEYTRCSRTS
ncbi:hypothetical protein BGX28_000439 [Mortierella sp. GBA30]|nr:hypothetical protein BGX28_000439 [Mortierella sp. GBA30]